MSAAYNAYIEKQDGIYTNAFRAKHAEVGVTAGVERDPGAEPQGAFIVAWRHPKTITGQVEEVSLAVGGIVRSITYGPDNAHTTLSDYGLQLGLIINPKPGSEDAETLDTLQRAVRSGLDTAGARTIGERAVHFEDTLTNGKTVVALGQANESVWKVNEAVKAAAGELGVELKGSWGSHMTIDRFLEDKSAKEAAPLTAYLGNVPNFGLSVPTEIMVGHFQTDPTTGFTLIPHERFEF